MRSKALAAASCLLLLSGCYKFSKTSTVVRSIYNDCNNTEYPKARTLFSSELRAAVDAGPAMNDGGTKTICDRLTNSNTMSSIDITREQVDGDRAVVTADIHFRDETTKRGQQTDLVREDGAWKLKR